MTNLQHLKNIEALQVLLKNPPRATESNSMYSATTAELEGFIAKTEQEISTLKAEKQTLRTGTDREIARLQRQIELAEQSFEHRTDVLKIGAGISKATTLLEQHMMDYSQHRELTQGQWAYPYEGSVFGNRVQVWEANVKMQLVDMFPKVNFVYMWNIAANMIMPQNSDEPETPDTFLRIVNKFLEMMKATGNYGN